MRRSPAFWTTASTSWGRKWRRSRGRLAAFTGAHAISCASGTDALVLALMALGVGPQDAVLVPSFTFIASAEAVVLAGAVPVFCDVGEDDFNLDPDRLDDALSVVRAAGLRPKGVIAVGLFGQPAAMDRIQVFCDAHSLWLLDDAFMRPGPV